MRRLLLLASLLAFTATSARAQDEAVLRDFFEGKSVIVKMDMPGTQEGVDVLADAQHPIDYTLYSARLRANGVAIQSGQPAIVTKVHVKDKLIEFQLGGGGFGTLLDDTGGGVTVVVSAPKSGREKELEKLLKDEPEGDRRRHMQRELDDLRDARAKEDARNRAIAIRAEEARKARVAAQRQQGGSRFNIRYPNGVPPGLGPDGVMRALADYVDFSGVSSTGALRPEGQRTVPLDPMAAPPTPARPLADTSALRKGMTRAEVEDLLGKPERASDRNEGTLRVTTVSYTRDDQRITAEFVEGVLIRYAISSR